MLKNYKLLLLVGIIIIGIIVMLISLPSIYSRYKISQLGLEEKEIVNQVIKEFTRVDRCDPFPCLDHFWLKSIKKLSEAKVMKNTGGAKLITDCNYNYFFIESSYAKINNSQVCICNKDSYQITLLHGSWLMFRPFKEELTICY